MIYTLEKEICGEKIIFTNRRALFWQREGILIFSDLHIGKTAHFRKSGIAVSSEVMLEDLKVLESLLGHFAPQKALIVGDMFHAGYNSDLEIFKGWRRKQPQEFVLVKGNHDRLKCEVYKSIGVDCTDHKHVISPFSFVHAPDACDKQYFTISGHIHPGVVLADKMQRIRLPCFALSERSLVLPAFSKFTGLDTHSLSRNFSNIVFGKDFIFEYTDIGRGS